MTADCYTLTLGECKSAFIEDVKRTTAVAAPVPFASLPKIVQKGRYCDTLRRDAARMCCHVFINFKRVRGKAAVFFMVAVAPTLEVARGVKV